MPDSNRLARRSRRPFSQLNGGGILLLVTLFASGCARLAPPPHTSAGNVSSEIHFKRVSLQRLGCISGDCPVYSVSIDEQGHIHYHGDAHVGVRGDRYALADAATLQRLQRVVLGADVFWLRARYTPGHANCGAWSMNDAAVIIVIDAPRLHKHIDHYLGCHNAPRVLQKIETAIDQASDIQRWISPN